MPREKDSPDFSRYYIFLASGENKLEEALNQLSKNIPAEKRWSCEVAPLQCGDILIGSYVDDEKEANYPQSDVGMAMAEVLGNKTTHIKPLIIIERKRIDDFCSSYRGGRLLSQRARLITFREKTGCQCHLVVEGFEKAMLGARGGKICNFTIDALEQAWISTNVRDKFFLQHVANETEHAFLIMQCLKTLEKYQLYDGHDHVAKKSYSESLKLKNKSNLTPQMYYIRMIGGLPMFSIDVATKIAEVYPTLNSLLDELRQNGHKNIQEIKVGKNRLGKVKAGRLVEYLLIE